MPLIPCSTLLWAAQAADYVVAGFSVANNIQAAGVIKSAEAFRIPLVIRLRSASDVASVVNDAKDASIPVGIHFEFPKNRTECLLVMENGASAITLSLSQTDFIKDITERGVLYEVDIPVFQEQNIRAAYAAGAKALRCLPPITWGAFTGRPYMVCDRLMPMVRKYPQLFFSIQGLSHASAEHIQEVSELPICQLVFQVPSDALAADAGRSAVENLRAMNRENTATLAL